MQIQEQIVQTKHCKNCNSEFHITDKDLEFYDKISPVFEGKKYEIPTPNFCPDCRQQRRLAFRNERKLYKRNCDATGKQIISIYSQDKKIPIYYSDQWFGDSWNGTDYGINIDFSKNISEQFEKLYAKVPKRALSNGKGSENCEYVNNVGMGKNCYLIFNSSHSENCYYGSNLRNCKDCVDNYIIKDSDVLYQCINCIDCYNSSFLQDCENCKESIFLKNCKNCDRCFGCVNLQGKQYYIFNKAYLNKDAYEKELLKINEKYSLEDFKNLYINFPTVNLLNINGENCIGNLINNSKNILNSFEVNNSQNIRYGFGISNTNDSTDITSIDGYVTGGCSKIYESGSVFELSSDIYFSSACRNNCHNLYYCIECRLSQNCFLCTGLKSKEYCIFNKQYSESDYKNLVPKIIEHMKKNGEWGEFFPISMSPFAYNETVAQEYFPLTKDEALAKGYKRKDDEDKNFQGPIYQPLSIDQYDENKVGKEIAEKNTNELLNGILKCEVTGRPYRIIKQELDFYLKHNLPIPKKHPDQRHAERMALRNPRKLYDRKCDKCGVEMKTTYAPERKEIVYCEACYNREIYG